MTKENPSAFSGLAPALASALVGGGLLLNAFFGTARTGESALAGSVFVLAVLTEWAIQRRLGDFVRQVTIISNSFDETFSALNARLGIVEDEVASHRARSSEADRRAPTSREQP